MSKHIPKGIVISSKPSDCLVGAFLCSDCLLEDRETYAKVLGAGYSLCLKHWNDRRGDKADLPRKETNGQTK